MRACVWVQIQRMSCQFFTQLLKLITNEKAREKATADMVEGPCCTHADPFTSPHYVVGGGGRDFFLETIRVSLLVPPD